MVCGFICCLICKKIINIHLFYSGDDDDDFYDRTKKTSSLKKSSDHQSVETADTLLDKKDAILREMEEKATLLQKEDSKTVSDVADNTQDGDALDAYVTGLSSELDVLYIDDLEAMIDEQMVGSFNVEIDDGSVKEQVAEELMLLHEECLQGKSIEKQRKSNPGTNAISQSTQVINENDNKSSDDEGSDMMVVIPSEKARPASVTTHKQQASIDEEEWSVVAPTKNRGRRSS